jgi:hypothetical protein
VLECIRPGEFKHSVLKGITSSHAITPFQAKYLLGYPTIVPEIWILDTGVAPRGRSRTVFSPLAALHPNMTAEPSTHVISPQVTSPATSLAPSGNPPRVLPQGRSITLDQALFTLLLENHKISLLIQVKEHEGQMQELIHSELSSHLANLYTLNQKTIRDEVYATILPVVKDLQKQMDDKIIARVNASTQAIQASINWELKQSKITMQAEMSQSLSEVLKTSADDIGKRVSKQKLKEDSRAGMVG